MDGDRAVVVPGMVVGPAAIGVDPAAGVGKQQHKIVF